MFYDDQGVLHVKSFSEIPDGFDGYYEYTPFYWRRPDLDSRNTSYWSREFHDIMSEKAFHIGWKYHGKPKLLQKKKEELYEKMYVDRINQFYRYRPFMNKEDEEFAKREIAHIINSDDYMMERPETFPDYPEIMKDKGIINYVPSPNK